MPLRATAQLALPGIDAVAVPLQVIEVPDTVAVAEPVPVMGTVPLQVAPNEPETDDAVRLVIVQVNAPQVPVWADAAWADDQVPVVTFVASETAAVVIDAAGAGDGDVATLPHADARTAAMTAEARTCRRMMRDCNTHL